MSARPIAGNRGLGCQLTCVRLLSDLSLVLPDATADALAQLMQDCQACDATAPRQLTDAIIAGLCAAASRGARSAWTPACAALRRNGGVLAGKRGRNCDCALFAGSQLVVLLHALQQPGVAGTEWGHEAGQHVLPVWLDLLTVVVEAAEVNGSTWQVRRCIPGLGSRV